MKPARIAAALAAALAGVLVASPVRAENDYDHAKGLIELRWFDMAERLLKKIPDKDKAEASLGLACLAKGRADASADLMQQEQLYQEALAKIAEYRNTAAKDHALQGEAMGLQGSVQQSLARVWDSMIHDARVPADKRKELVDKLNKIRKEANENLIGAMAQVEAAYAKALKDYRNPINNDPKWEKAKFQAFDAYVRAAQKCLNEMFRNAEQQDPGSAEQKGSGLQIVRIVTDWLKKQNETYSEPLGDETAGVRMYMDYAMGRGLAFAGKAEDAGKELDKVIEIELSNFEAGPAREYATAVKTRCIYYKARAWADKAKISKAEADWHKALQSNWHEIFAGGAGSDPALNIKARILKGECHGKVSQFSTGVDDLNKALAEIERAERDRTLRPEICQSLRWEAYQVMAELVNEMRRRGVPVFVAPEVLVQAGLVSYRQEQYEQAIGCFRDAIARAHMSDIAGDWAKRLVIEGEPTAWYLMGNAYHRMGSELEAQLAYEGCLVTFWGLEGKAIPAAFQTANASLMAQLKSRVLTPCANNGRIAANEELLLSRSKFNENRIDEWLSWQVRLDPEEVRNQEYYRARRLFDNARQAARDSREAERRGQSAAALQKRTEALQGFDKAEKAFLALAQDSPMREEGIYSAGMCCYEAMSLLERRNLTEEEKRLSDELSDRALQHFADFKKFVKDTPPRPRSPDVTAAAQERREIEGRRTTRLATIDLTEPFIHFAAKKYPKALEAAEKLRPRQDLDATQQEGLHNILFKCYNEVGLIQKDLAQAKAMLLNAEKEAAWFLELSEKAQGDANETKEAKQERLKRQYYGMAGRLAASYLALFNRAKALGQGEKEGREFYALRAKWLDEVSKDPANKTIDGLGIVAKTFFELNDYAKAKEKYEDLLKYDTRGDRTKVPDDKLISFDTLKAAVKGADFPTREMMGKGRQRLDAIKTATLGGEMAREDADGVITKVPIPKDYDKAVVAIGRFLDDFKNYDTVEGKVGEARKGLEAIREELEFRLKMLRASNEITTCYVALGKQAQEEKRKEDAKAAFQEGLKNAENALKLWPKDAELLYNRGFCLLASGETANLEEALKVLGELRRGTRYGGELWWKCTKSYVQALIDLGKHEDARAIIVQILLTTDEQALKFSWPEIRAVATGLAEKVFPGTTGEAALAKLLGDKVPVPNFDYTPKSELEKEIGRQIFSLKIDVKNGKLSEADGKFREELLKELVQISKDKPAMLRDAKEAPDSLMFMIINGRLRSLKSLGGVSRGEENDKFQPELKAEPKKAPEPPAEKGAALNVSAGLTLAPTLSVEGQA